MSYQQGSAVSVAAVLTVATVIITAYRLHHTDVNTTHRAERTGRREVADLKTSIEAWSPPA